MYAYQDINDTIAAISTPTGAGGIGIVRLSGKDALAIADRIFAAKRKTLPSQFSSHTVHYGWIKDGEEVLDEVLLTVMRAPHSYTTEDIVEISCHGGTVSLKAILYLVLAQGARLAEPGEFTKRAYLNGRLDLTQAEAVLDIIQSKTDAFLKISTHQLKGDLSRELEVIREGLMSIYVELEAIVNFPEDEIDAQGRTGISKNILENKTRVDRLLASGEKGRILREGIQIVLCGKPNVGKSSLLNLLLKTPRAIVSDIAGTTRDTIEEAAQIQGIPLRIVDTAGILEPRDSIEEEAVKRSHMHMAAADLVLLVLDVSEPLDAKDKAVIQKLNNPHVLIVYNKCDKPARLDKEDVQKLLPQESGVEVSVLHRQGLEHLEEQIIELVWQAEEPNAQGILVSNVRHIEALRQASAGLEKAARLIVEGISLEFVSEEIKVAVNFLDAVTGKNIDHDLLETIFSQFCIGK